MKTSLPLKSISRWVWSLLVAVYLLLFVLGLPQLIQQYHSLTGIALQTGFSRWTTLDLQITLEDLGLSNQFYTFYRVSFELVITFMFVGLGILIFIRRSDEWIGWFTSLFLIGFGIVFNNSLGALARANPALAEWVYWLVGLPWFMFYLFFYIYPDGKFVPRWTRIWVIVLFLFITLASFQPEFFDRNIQFAAIGVTPIFGSAVFAQIYRYTRISDAVQRAQTKWIMYAIGLIALMEVVGQGVLRAAFPALDSGTTRLVYEMTLIAFTPLFGMIPLALTIAILRYRLWDIDVLIRRTLQYTLVTGLLALIYFGIVILFQSLFFRDQTSEIAIVVSTLAIAALFNPLRIRIQNFIDRRFYRKKYNAEQALAQFAVTARDEVELDKLTAALIGVVNETVQPERISLWLKDFNTKPQRSEDAKKK